MLDRYVVGELISDDPEEEARQKKYKAVLNKLTPENFDRMFEQVRRITSIFDCDRIHWYSCLVLFFTSRVCWCSAVS